ncbi:putative amidohydrolase [Neomicrococcus aestuarii]|uniref:Putative amidohydrolase n=1 Tax=Neomicrococcus aestuarii TaxID=556325 RepID=A0A7W8X1A4_9MICC|nr:carbon-nitrogen hydrolase family protein [Neomicrococcus aestuarii]MBB5512569.1 putative amidohydrolase [Neomicrococcus aestuarii]
MKISVGQIAPTGDVAKNLEIMGRLASHAAAEGVQLILFPEESMFTVKAVEGDFREAVARDWPIFSEGLARITEKNGIAVVAGGYEPNNGDRPYNTVLAVDASGAELKTYRKIHLYDAFSYQESRTISAGDPNDIPIFTVGGLKFGVMTCYDIRFPEVARRLAVHGAEVILVPAAWFKGDHKVEHWRTLLKARAVENTVWVAAAGSATDSTVGYSAILDPVSIAVDFLEGEPEGVATADVSRKRIDEVREFLPVLVNRRIGVEAEVAAVKTSSIPIV